MYMHCVCEVPRVFLRVTVPLLLCVLGDEPSAAHPDAVQLQDRIDGSGVSRLMAGNGCRVSSCLLVPHSLQAPGAAEALAALVFFPSAGFSS